MCTASGASNDIDGGMSEALYFKPHPETTEVPTKFDLQEEIKSAVPLTRVLESSGELMSAGVDRGSFLPLTRHLSLNADERTPFLSMAGEAPGEGTRDDNRDKPSLQEREAYEKVQDKPSMRVKRPLVKRRGSSDLDHRDLEDDDDSSLGYISLPPSGGAVAHGREVPSIPVIPFDELMLIETLGTGRVSTIYRAVWRQLSTCNDTSGVNMLALKVAMVNPKTFDSSHIDELRREADIAARLSHANVCELVGIAADSEYVF